MNMFEDFVEPTNCLIKSIELSILFAKTSVTNLKMHEINPIVNVEIE